MLAAANRPSEISMGSHVSQCSRGKWALGLPTRNSSWTWKRKHTKDSFPDTSIPTYYVYVLSALYVSRKVDYPASRSVSWEQLLVELFPFLLLLLVPCNMQPIWVRLWRHRGNSWQSQWHSTCHSHTPEVPHPRAVWSRSKLALQRGRRQ